MFQEITAILDYVVESFIHIWPYLLVTIPISVAVKMSGASGYISRAFSARPMVAIILATIVGAFSPFCSCSVIPVVAALLIGGVPLAPVMSFWLASPSMDPEIFFLSVSSLGWNLAMWRLAATLVLSLSGGFITHFLVQRDWLGKEILRNSRSIKVKTLWKLFGEGLTVITYKLGKLFPAQRLAIPALNTETAVCADVACTATEAPLVQFSAASAMASSHIPLAQEENQHSAPSDTELGLTSSSEDKTDFWKKLGNETWTATILVIKFMLLAWFIGALISLYVPEEWIIAVLGRDKAWSIIIAAFLGIPVYTSNLTAMPLIGSLLGQGMSPAAALAFLLAGPMTTLPAMSAVFGLVNRKVFALYIGFALIGAMIGGYAFQIIER